MPYPISHTLSILFYPLLAPTYGALLYFLALQRLQTYPMALAAIGVGGTLLLTCLLPLSILLVMLRRGNITDLYINNPKQRTMPYIYCAIGFVFWTYFCSQVLHLPAFFVYSAGGGTAALLLVLLINLRWKISAHLTGMGGLFGGVMSFYLYTGQSPWIALAVLLALSLLLMIARISEQAHTPMQTVCGLLLGLSCTFLPNLLLL